MQRALIFSSNFDGHRQVYVFVIAHILRELGYEIVIAGNFSANLNNTFYIDKLVKNNEIIKIDTYGYAGFGINISNSEFLNLQKKHNISLTVFAEADNHLPLFISQILPFNERFQGRLVGIFLRPWYFYEKLSFIDKLRYIKNLKKRWKFDKRLFHELLNSHFNLLDNSMHIDEYFVSKHVKCSWLPDVFQQYADNIVREETSDQRVWVERLDNFIQGNKGCFILLYFGTSQQRRGYAELLKLAIDFNACFVHCGLRNDNESYIYDVNNLREILNNNNKLFETNQYITDPYCIEYFFKAVSHLVLPYINFLGSSGVMLQALSYGIPVLVPDIGIIGYRTRNFNLGLTYSPGLLEKQFFKFKETPIENFANSIGGYMNFQTEDRLHEALTRALIGIEGTILHP
jgi:hypothetical protein